MLIHRDDRDVTRENIVKNQTKNQGKRKQEIVKVNVNLFITNNPFSNETNQFKSHTITTLKISYVLEMSRL